MSGGLTTHDLTVNVLPRGSVRFTLTKDMSGFNPPARTRSDIPRQYIFEEIGKFDVTVKNTETNNLVTFEQLPVTFSIHFDDEENAETPPGYQTSTCACDSLLSLPAGNYVVLRYLTYDSDGILLETNNSPVESPFTVEDNRTTEADVAVTLYEADEYMKDHYALYAIWKALHGEEWSYQGRELPHRFELGLQQGSGPVELPARRRGPHQRTRGQNRPQRLSDSTATCPRRSASSRSSWSCTSAHTTT